MIHMCYYSTIFLVLNWHGLLEILDVFILLIWYLNRQLVDFDDIFSHIEVVDFFCHCCRRCQLATQGSRTLYIPLKHR